MVETKPNVFIDDIIKSVINKFNDIDMQMERTGFSIKFMSGLSVRCDKVNVTKSPSYMKLPNWLRYKNAAINPKNIKDWFYQYSFFAGKQYHKELKNQP